MKRSICLIALLNAFFSLWAQELKLPSVFSDHMVLQAGKHTPVFGTARPGAVVQVRFLGRTESFTTKAVADEQGRWKAVFLELPAGLWGELSVSVDDETKTFMDALVGEVWLCAGQSNMAFSIRSGPNSGSRIKTAQEEAVSSKGQIRLFRVKQYGADTQQSDVIARGGSWEVITAKNVEQCTAVGWNFAARLHGETGLPVGLISTNWGGTRIEAWMSKEAIDGSGAADRVWSQEAKDREQWRKKNETYLEALAAFKEKYPTEQAQKAHAKSLPRPPDSPINRNTPTHLYNAMVSGLMPYGARGILWYQGENNAGVDRAAYYGPLACSLVRSWRQGFENPDMAFYYVELANFRKKQSAPVELKGWGLIRESQASVLDLPNTGVATAIDVGIANDVHPTDKKTVGNRLAGMALNDIYGHKSLCRSPQYASHEVKGDKVIVKLDYGEGLRSRTEKVEGFAIRGEDGEWVWAEKSRILSDGSVEVSSAQVKEPVAVRYGWASNPIISLENEAGLPLRPFRTDKESDL